MPVINPNNYDTVIGIDGDVLAGLTERARPFVDDPNAVLRRLLELDPPESRGTTSTNGTAAGTRPRSSSRRSGRAARSSTKPPRAPKGSLTPEEAFEQPILTVLDEAGGSLPYREALTAVGERMEPILNEHDRFTDDKGVARWEKRVPFVRLRLVERGLLAGDAPRGIWQLTDQGRAALAETAAG